MTKKHTRYAAAIAAAGLILTAVSLPASAQERDEAAKKATGGGEKRPASQPIRDGKPASKPPRNNTERIESALESDVNVEFVGSSLQDAVEYWSDLCQIPIRIKTRELEEEGISPEEEFSLILAGIRMSDALDIIIGNEIGDLTYVVENDVVWVTSLSDADSGLTTRLYPVPAGLAATEVGTMLVEHRLAPDVCGPRVAENGRVSAVGNTLVVTQSHSGHRVVKDFLGLLEGLEGSIEAVPVPRKKPAAPTPASRGSNAGHEFGNTFSDGF